MDNKLSELKYALECLEGAQYDGEWNSALVGGGGDGAEYPAVTNLAGVVVRTARLGPHEARLCEYLEAVSPSNIRALLAELEASKQYAKERDAENESLALTVGRLRTKLATPVRLPDVLFIGRYPAPLMRAEQVKERISAAGFTVEGDK